MKRISVVFVMALTMQWAFSQQINKVAVVSIYANKAIHPDWNGGLIGSLIQLSDNEKFNTQKIESDLRDMIFTDLAKEFPFEFISQDSIINNINYQALIKDPSAFVEAMSAMDASADEPLEGYMMFNYNSNKLEKRLFEIFPEADAIMIVDLEFYLQGSTLLLNTTVGPAYAKAYANFKLIDKSGKKVMSLRASGLNENDKVKVAANQIVKNKEFIPDYMNTAIELLFVDIKANLPKKVQKMYKKLSKIYK